jgi:hypothetical protein
MELSIKDLLYTRSKYQEAINQINSTLESIDPQEYFNQLIKGKFFICEGHGHFVQDNMWYLYKPKEIIFDKWTKMFDIVCEEGYETFSDEVGVSPGYAKFIGHLRYNNEYRFHMNIHYTYDNVLKEVTEEEFWNKLSKETGVPVEKLKTFEITHKEYGGGTFRID